MWLLDKNTFLELSELKKQALVGKDIRAFNDLSANNNNLNILEINSGIAEINIKGILTNAVPSLFSMFFGASQTSYQSIIDAIMKASADENVERIVFNINSPGGNIDGLFNTMKIINSIQKPTSTIIESMAASAAYMLASQTDEIFATCETDRIGSIGVITSYYLDEDIIDITSTDAPNKAPDVTTDAGKNAVIGELDKLHNLFVSKIASGRKTNIKNINSNFGKGGLLLSSEAIDVGMIDGIIEKNFNLTTNKKAMTDKAITQEMLEAKYLEGINAGISKEKDRICAHLKMGKSSGDMETAISAIESGEKMTDTLIATYLASSMANKAIDARLLDSSNIEAADNLNKEPVSTGIEDQVANLLCNNL